MHKNAQETSAFLNELVNDLPNDKEVEIIYEDMDGQTLTKLVQDKIIAEKERLI